MPTRPLHRSGSLFRCHRYQYRNAGRYRHGHTRTHPSIESRTPVIILGLNVTVDAAVNALRNGVFDFIITPFSPEQLTRSLQRAVRNRRQRENEKLYLKEIEEKLKESISRTGQSLDMELIDRFAAVAEFRDPTDLAHNVRIGQYCPILARALRFRLTLSKPSASAVLFMT